MLKINPYIFVKIPQFVDLTRFLYSLKTTKTYKKEFGGACLKF